MRDGGVSCSYKVEYYHLHCTCYIVITIKFVFNEKQINIFGHFKWISEWEHLASYKYIPQVAKSVPPCTSLYHGCAILYQPVPWEGWSVLPTQRCEKGGAWYGGTLHTCPYQSEFVPNAPCVSSVFSL